MNYFEMARNELSQDFFFQWILLYANKRECYNEKVYKCSKKIIELLTNQDVAEDYKVECYSQISVKEVRYDLLLIIFNGSNRKIFIIEDKFNAAVNNNFKLYKENYLNNNVKNFNFTDEEKTATKWICIKTGIVSSSDKTYLNKHKIQLFDSSMLQPIFEEYYKSDNDVFDDFVESKFLNDYQQKPIIEWLENDYKKFFVHLVEKVEFQKTNFRILEHYSKRIIKFQNNRFTITFDFHSKKGGKNIQVKLKYNDDNDSFDFKKTCYFKNYSGDGYQGIDMPINRKCHKVYSERERHILDYLNELDKFSKGE